MPTQPKTFLTPEQYLEIERKAEHKSEYYQGEMFAMAGATFAHNLVVGNTVRELGQQLLDSPCVVVSNDLRVRVASSDLYTYPDVVVVCGPPDLQDGHFDTLLNPAVLVEVLSPSTEAYDRGRKFERYQSIESLREYVLIALDRVHADLFTRQADGRWLLSSARSLEDSLTLESLNCHLSLAAIYRKVEFTPPARVSE